MDMTTDDVLSLANDVVALRAKHACMSKLERMKHANLLYRLNNGTAKWKQLLTNAVHERNDVWAHVGKRG